MKYKVGDKVKIKTWEEMEEEFGLDKYGSINMSSIYSFSENKEKYFKEYAPDRIVEINLIDITPYHYGIKESPIWYFNDEMIKELISELEERERINSRFDILDIR